MLMMGTVILSAALAAAEAIDASMGDASDSGWSGGWAAWGLGGPILVGLFALCTTQAVLQSKQRARAQEALSDAVASMLPGGPEAIELFEKNPRTGEFVMGQPCQSVLRT